MRSRNDITDTLRSIFERQLQRKVDAEWESDIQRDLELDSMKQLAVIVEIENHFEIAFDPEDDSVRTVGELVRTIERHLGIEPA